MNLQKLLVLGATVLFVLGAVKVAWLPDLPWVPLGLALLAGSQIRD